MEGFYIRVAALLWAAWLISWTAAAFWRNRPTTAVLRGKYRWHLWLVAIGLAVLFGARSDRGPALWAVGPVLGWSMVGVVAASLAFSWWARIEMGRLWSGGIVRTAEHRVIDSGPFSLVRHPIYTALIAASVAVAVLRAIPSALVGASLVALGFVLKARLEERFLETELGGYDAYRARVPMIVPFVRWRA